MESEGRAFAEGRLALTRGDFKGAERAFEAMLAAAPASAYAMISLLYARSRQPNRLVRFGLMRRALRAAPNDVYVLVTAARIHLAVGHAQAALKMLQSAVAIEPRSSEINALRSAAFASLGLRGDSDSALQLAMSINPFCPVAISVKDYCDRKFGRDGRATDFARGRLRSNPEDPNAHMGVGKEELFHGEVEQSFWHYREALRLEPNSMEALEGLKENLRHRNPVYNWFFRHGLSKLQDQGLYWLVVGLVFMRLVFAVAPGPLPVAVVLSIGAPIALAVAALFLPMPIVNLVTRLDPLVRKSLSWIEKGEMTLTCALILSAFTFGVMFFKTKLIGYEMGWMAAVLFYAIHGAMLALAPRIEARSLGLLRIAILWPVFGVLLPLT